MIPVKGLFLLQASIQAQIIVKGISRNGTATKIKTIYETWMRPKRPCGGFEKHDVLQRRFSKIINLPLTESTKQALNVWGNECNEIIICLTNLCNAFIVLRLHFCHTVRTFEARTRGKFTGLATSSALTRISQQKSCKVCKARGTSFISLFSREVALRSTKSPEFLVLRAGY